VAENAATSGRDGSLRAVWILLWRGELRESTRSKAAAHAPTFASIALTGDKLRLQGCRFQKGRPEMTQGGIEPEKITQPMQLAAAWFATLVLLVSAFIGGANTASRPFWLPSLFGLSAVLIVPMFAALVFRLMTKHRFELQADPFYSKNRAEERALRGFVPENVTGPRSGEVLESELDESADLEKIRDQIYERNRGLFLVHTWRPSQVPGQVVDISIRLHEHGKQWTPLSDGAVDRVEYFVGRHFFGGRAVVKTNAGERFRLDISSYGTTNCLARVHFNDGTEPIILDRYLDWVVTPASS
jgi:hypothetical protein